MQGTVYYVGRRMTMVWTSDNLVVRIKPRNDVSVGDCIDFSSSELIRKSRTSRTVMSYRQIGLLLTMAFLALAFVISALQGSFTGSNLPPPALDVSVDIHSSVLLSVASDGTVVSVQAQNKAAEKLRLQTLIGKQLDRALSDIVQQVTKAGWIDPADGVPDFVTITAVDLENHKEIFAKITDGLDQVASRDRNLSAVNLVMDTADDHEMLTVKPRDSEHKDKDLGTDVHHKKPEPASSQTAGMTGSGEDEKPAVPSVKKTKVGENVNKVSKHIQSKDSNFESPVVSGSAEDKKAAPPAAPVKAPESAPVAVAEKIADPPASNSPAAEKKADNPTANTPAEEKKADPPASNSPAAENKTEKSVAPGQAKKQER